MKLLYSFAVITVLIAVAVALPSKTREEIVAEGNQLVEDLEQYEEAAPVEQRATRCSKQMGQICKYNCECCGVTVVCATYYVGGTAVSRCGDKTSNNAVLNTIGKGMNFVANGFSSISCWG
uniref:U3-hexatoxin-Hib n=1 Tax=Hadronyche infensa TaxID=153481 RepID=A0A1D0C013_HADIN